MRRTWALVLTLAAVACDRPPPPESLPEWTSADHGRGADEAKVQAGAQASAGAKNPKSNGAALVEATWKTQCARCHGPMGHGDGPDGAMVQAKDLTNAEWQAKTSDVDMALSIKNGKNKMPKFDLPDAVVVGLVQRVRASRGK